jgi:diaminopimelate decarboxylase
MNHTQILPEYIQGISVLKMSDSYGTPLYIYDAAIIASQVKYLKECFSFEKFRIHYAAKALSNSHILKLIHRLGCGVDAVSREEMEIALAAGIPPRDLNFSPSGAPISEYIFALDNRICCHVDNLGVLEVLAEQVSNLEVVLRCNPDIRAGGHAHLEIGAGDSKFGIYPEELPLIKKLIAKYGIKIIGIHAHVGSDIADENYFIRAFEYLLSLAEHFPDHLEKGSIDHYRL